MKLYASEGQIAVSYAFVGTVVGIDEPCFPGAGKTFYIDRIAVILRGHVAAVCADFNAWLILTSMTKLQLVCVSSSRQRKNLGPKADTEQGHLLFYQFADMGDGSVSHFRITWTIRDHHPVKVFTLKIVVVGDSQYSYTAVH